MLSRVGQRWDDVYSEICEHLNRTSTVHDHIFQHLFHYVEKDTFIGADGEVCVNSRWGQGAINVNDYYCDAFIHPISGILCKPIDRRTYNRIIKAREERLCKLRQKYRVVSDSLMFARDEHNDKNHSWFAIEIEPAVKAWERQLKENAVANTRHGKFYFIQSCKEKYGAAVYPTSGVRRSASKKDIKKYSLN